MAEPRAALCSPLPSCSGRVDNGRRQPKDRAPRNSATRLRAPKVVQGSSRFGTTHRRNPRAIRASVAAGDADSRGGEGEGGFTIRGEELISSGTPEMASEGVGKEDVGEAAAAPWEPGVTEERAEAAEVETVAAPSELVVPSTVEADGKQEAVTMTYTPQGVEPAQAQNLLTRPLESIQDAGSALSSVQLTPVTVMMVLVMSTFTALGAAMFAVIKIMQPSLKATEKAAKAMELAAKDLQSAAKGMKQTADMFQADVPVLFADLQTTSREFTELGQTLNVVSGGWVGAPKSSRSRKQEEGGAKSARSSTSSNGVPSSYNRPSPPDRPSSMRGNGGRGGAPAVRPPRKQPSSDDRKAEQRDALDKEQRKSSGASVGEAAEEEQELRPQGWYGGTVSSLMRMTRDVSKLTDVISPTVSTIKDRIGSVALVFDAKSRAEGERRKRVESAQRWIDDWRARTGVTHVTSAGAPADASKLTVGGRAESPAKEEEEEMMASLSATAVYDSSFEDDTYQRGWLGWEQEGPSQSWDDSSEPLASGMDIGYKDIINSAEELAMAGGSRTAAFHLFDKLVPERDSDLRFLRRSQSNILVSVDDDDDYFEREGYVDSVTPLDERLFVGSDIAVTRLSKGRRKSAGGGAGSTSPASSEPGPPGSLNALDRQRKRQA